jgi:hypothetical protein
MESRFLETGQETGPFGALSVSKNQFLKNWLDPNRALVPYTENWCLPDFTQTRNMGSLAFSLFCKCDFIHTIPGQYSLF